MPSQSRVLNIIVAATPTLGIGRAGGLPWPQLKSEMAHFRRATTNVRASNHPSNNPSMRNAVIMGRNTWESIPPRFRPLKGRFNVVVTSDPTRVVGDVNAQSLPTDVTTNSDGPRTAKSLDDALDLLTKEPTSAEQGSTVTRAGANVSSDVFVIGGAGLYRAALEHPVCRRVLLTRVEKEYECDVFFPLDMFGEEARAKGWAQRDIILSEWAEAPVRLEEKDVPFEFCLFER